MYIKDSWSYMYIKDSWSCQSYGMYNNNRGIVLYVCLLRAH